MPTGKCRNYSIQFAESAAGAVRWVTAPLKGSERSKPLRWASGVHLFLQVFDGSCCALCLLASWLHGLQHGTLAETRFLVLTSPGVEL